jgi:hypothetical protein
VRGKGGKVRPTELRHVRELIRQRYTLDLETWGYLTVAQHNRPLVEEKMRRVDGLLWRIRALVLSLDHRDHFQSDAEYHRCSEVKARVLEDGKRDWAKHPPWQDLE